MNAVSQLASLALPPIGGLIAILGGYILLIGPLNYLVLKRLDRRELAWITMPVLIAVFAVSAYGFGTALRGTRPHRQRGRDRPRRPGRHRGDGAGLPRDLLALPGHVPGRGARRGAPRARRSAATSPSAATPGPSTWSRATRPSCEPVGRLQLAADDPRRIGDHRAPAGGRARARRRASLSGTIRNRSARALEKVAVVLGGSVAVVGDIAAGRREDGDAQARPATRSSSRCRTGSSARSSSATRRS